MGVSQGFTAHVAAPSMRTPVHLALQLSIVIITDIYTFETNPTNTKSLSEQVIVSRSRD